MSAVPKFGFKAEDLIKKGRTTKSKLEDLKKWLTHHPNIPKMSDEQIAVFLISCNNEIEETEKTIEAYFKCKASAPELFTNRDVDSEIIQFTHGVTKFAHLPKRTKENYAVCYGGLRDTYYYNYNLEAQVKVAFTLIEDTLYSDPPDGLIFILSLKGVGIMHLTRIKIGILKILFVYLQEALPTKLKEVHVMDASYIFEKLLAVMKPFMKKELYDLIIPHPPGSNMDDFFEKYLPANCMPADYGGELPYLEELCEKTQNHCRKLRAFQEENERQVEIYRKNTKK